jgi:HEPN domain-containing protein
MFRGSRDFLLAYRLLGRRRADPDVRAARAPGPFQSWVVCASLALELALKCRIALDGKDPSWTHSYVKLFAELSPAAQQDIASRVAFTEGLSTAERVATLLKD